MLVYLSATLFFLFPPLSTSITFSLLLFSPQLITAHLEEAASELDEIPNLHLLPEEGREYLEGLEVRRRGGGTRRLHM